MATEKEDTKQLTLVQRLEQEALSIPETLTTEDDAFVATDTLLKVRKLYKDIDSKRTDRTAPANATIKIINSDFKPFLAPLAEAEKKLIQMLETYADTRASQDEAKLAIVRKETGDNSLMIPIGLRSIPSAVGEVRFRQGFSVEIYDDSQIPEEYLTVDMKAIQKAVDDAEGNIEIPGVKINRSNSVSIYVK